MPRTGGNAHKRRRARRSAERRSDRSARLAVEQTTVAELEDLDFASLLVAATGPPVETAPADVEDADESHPELSALARLAEFQNGVLCQCGHSYAEHVGATGTCSHEDGRGTCTCGSFADADSETLVAAAGDVAWGPEDGFLDLLGDVNEILSGSNMAEGDGYLRAVDVGVGLDKVLICDYDSDGYWSAPITIDGDGDPVLSDRDAWLPVEQGWVEVAASDDEDASEASIGEAANVPRAGELSGSWLRFSLRNLVFADNEVELPDEHRPGARVPKIRSSPVPSDPTPPVGAANGIRAWEATFVPEGTLTDDGRAFAPGSLEWRELPLTLMAMINTSAEGGHDGALVSGRIDRMWREGSLIRAAGVFDEGEYGTDIARMVGDGTLRGLSVDIAIHEYEVGPVSDYFSEDGEWRTDASASELTPADRMFDGSDERLIFVVTKGVIGMATVCPFPAFAEASISLLASGAGFRYSHEGGFITSLRPLVAAAIAPADEAEAEEPEVAEEALTAAAAGHAPIAPPAEWFANPELEELTALSIDDDGRIYGHAWAWDTCHIAFADACVLAPRSQTENAYFHLGEIECADGERLSVGKVTLDAPHAGQRLSRGDATAHYDHTGTVAGHVRCGEDEFGGWVAGAVSPDLSEEKLRLLRGSVLSGDWRSVNGNLELVALLAVNVPGFPVPRTRALVASGDDGREVLSLTAAGIVLERTDEDDLAAIAALAAQARG